MVHNIHNDIFFNHDSQWVNIHRCAYLNKPVFSEILNLEIDWNEYESLGYLTMYNQESPSIGPFHYHKKGFR